MRQNLAGPGVGRPPRRPTATLRRMAPLLRFARVRIESVDGPIAADMVARARRLLGEGGVLELVERHSLHPWAVDPWGRLAGELERAERRLRALLPAAPEGALADVVAVDRELPEAEVPCLLVLEGGPILGRVLRADAALRAGWAVLRWGDNPPGEPQVVLPDGAHSVAFAAFAAVLPDDATPTILAPPSAEEDPPYAALLGVAAVRVRAFSELPASAAPGLEEALGPDPGLVVVAVEPRPSVLLTVLGLLRSGATLVLVPQRGLPVEAAWQPSLAAELDGCLVLAVERRTGLGATPLDEPVVPIRDGVPGAAVAPVAGQFSLPLGPSTWLAEAGEPTRLRAAVTVLAKEGPPIELVDGPGAEAGRRAVLLRLDASPLHRLAVQAARLDCEGVLDAGAILRDGAPTDLPPAARTVRAERVVRRLLAAGYPVAGARLGGEWVPAPSPRERLELLTGAAPTTASALRFEWDNGAARRRLIELIRRARSAVELQTYQVEDGPAVREVELALAQAAARGVAVRLLADAVWSARGTVDSLSPVLARLARCPGIAVRLARPLSGLPTVAAFKQRDHRKLCVFDGRVAVVGGRNLGEVYLRGFDEVPLWERSTYREIPWLDVGAEVEGPVVGALRAAFEGVWSAATPAGEEVEREPLPTPVAEGGSIDVRLVLHEGLADAHSLELARDVIDGARRRLSVVNTFPLQFELLEALQRALRRGVAVRVLVGNVRPLHGERVPFPGGGVRDLANEVIHGRLDTLARDGAAVHEYVPAMRPGWDPALVRVLPHVHAKVLSADGLRCSVGSANLDITAAYWESEVVLLVEDAAATAGLDAQLDAFFAGSPRLDDAADWSARAGRREWLSRNWPASIG